MTQEMLEEPRTAAFRKTAGRAVTLVGAALALAACGGGERRGAMDSVGAVPTDSLRKTSDSAVAAGDVALDSMKQRGATPAGGLAAGAQRAASATADDPSLAGAAGNMSAENMIAMISLSNRNEIRTSELARTRASNPQVKAFATRMLSDHQAMQKQADALGVKADEPPRADEVKQMGDSLASALQALQGHEFDVAYMSGQVMAHQRTLRELETYNDMAVRTDVKNLANQAVPKVRAHLEEAQSIAAKLAGAKPVGPKR